MEKKLMRSPDKKLCGVCSGVADYFNIDPTIIRLATALVALYTAVVPALIVYLVVALIMPKPPENYYQIVCNTSSRLTKGHDKKISGVCSGFAERLGLDTTIVRVIFILLVLLFGTGVLAYIVCACIMPDAPDFNYNGQPYEAPYNQPPYQNGQPYQNSQQYPPQQPAEPNEPTE